MLTRKLECRRPRCWLISRAVISPRSDRGQSPRFGASQLAANRRARCHFIRSYVSLHTTLNTYVHIISSGTLSCLYSQRQIKGLVRLAATHILSSGGAVRGIQYWGTETLPQRMRSHGTNHDHGEYVLSFYVVPFENSMHSLPATGQCISTHHLKSRKV